MTRIVHVLVGLVAAVCAIVAVVGVVALGGLMLGAVGMWRLITAPARQLARGYWARKWRLILRRDARQCAAGGCVVCQAVLDQPSDVLRIGGR